MALQNAAPVATPTALPLGYKWVRINMKTNRIAAPYYVDQKGDPTTLDTRVCWDGETEQLSPGGARACDANGMQPVYMLTSLAMAQGTRNLLRAEVVGTSIRPPGAITVDVGSSTNATPISATFSLPLGTANTALVPTTSIDGRPYGINGAASSACSPVAALASNTPQGTTSLQSGLNALRLSIVLAANNSCNADGSSVSASNPCTPPLAWVRSQQLSTTITSSSPSPAPTPTPVPIPTPTPSSSGGHSGPGGGDDDEHPRATPTPTPIPTPTPTPTPVTSSDYRSLDLSSPMLSSVPLFVGNPGNSGDPATYQSQTPNIVANANKAVLDYIATRKASGTNYFALASTSLNPAQVYGTPDQPAVLVITDNSWTLNASLTGFGILQVPNDFEISSNLQWTGIVMVQPAQGMSLGKFLINTGATGIINGALMLQAGDQFVLTTSNTGAAFKVTYSCDAIDAAMGNRPLKVVSHTETTY